MKKTDILILSSVVLYTILFYEQFAGVNFLIFNAILIAFLLIKDNGLIRNIPWVGAALGGIATCIGILLYGNPLCVFSNILSLVLLANYSINKNSSLIFAGIHSSYTFISALPFFGVRMVERHGKKDSDKNLGIKILIVLVPIIITAIFILLYRSANPIFKNYTDQLNLDFISWKWLRFVLLGWMLLYAFFNQIDIPFLTRKDAQGKDKLIADDYTVTTASQGIRYENLSGIILFTLLNILLLFLNMIDVHSIWFASALPEGMTHSELVHQGVGLLIVSIVIAISIILFFFRGTLNFYSTNQTIKILAYAWILQNIILIATTASKNQIYIQEYSLTYKRIGVDFYLLLAFIGLITTFIKINGTKSNWFLFRKNAWLFYAVLVISCFFNWDLLITRYNIQQSATNVNRELDKLYLLSLSESSLPDLMRLEKPNANSFTNTDHQNYIDKLDPMAIKRMAQNNPEFYMENLNSALATYLNKMKDTGWQSFNFEDLRVRQELIELNQKKIFTTINLSRNEVESIAWLRMFRETDSMNLNGTGFKALEQLSQFPKLKRLDISLNGITDLNSLPTLNELAILNISNNAITNLKPLYSLPQLQELDITGMQEVNVDQIKNLKQLKVLSCTSLTKSEYEDLKLSNPALTIKVETVYDLAIPNQDEQSIPADTTQIIQ